MSHPEDDRHKAKMAKRKAVQDAEVAAKPILEKGLLIVHTGPGKGKSTAAFGLALRALGRGLRVGVVQFIKGAWSTGERIAIERFGDQVEWRTMGEGFTWETQDRARDVAAASAAWAEAKRMMADPSIRLLVLDELSIALRYDYLPLAEVVAALVARRPGLHVVVDRPQRQAGNDRGRRLRHRVRACEAPLRRRCARAGGDRILTARVLMFQGTGSDVGKSLIVAGLCRTFARRGLRVRPFKPQNMSNNAAVTEDGGEIGRAQALQARACGVSPSVHMNPILLKPQSEVGAQVVVQGKVIGNARAREYQALKPKLMSAVLDSYARVKAEADLVLVEGAGSAAELNLREGDIANMGFARAANCPVVLIGDIDRGGIFAQILGVKTALAPEDAATIVGFIVNKFRGDATLFEGAMETIAERTGWRAFGLLPFFADAARLPAEDAFGLGDKRARAVGAVTIAVPMLARIANFDDFDPLRMEPSVRLVFVRPGAPLPLADLVILPGSKATIADLKFFREQGWDIDLLAHARRGGRVFGICGGYQMLGKKVSDPHGMEGPPGEIEGLGLLDVATVLTGTKTLSQVEGECLTNGAPFRGYEMHVGETSGPDCARPLVRFADGQLDGAISPDGLITGAYVHGLFADDRQRAAWLALLGTTSGISYEATIEQTLDALADHCEAHLDCDALLDAAH